MCNNHSYVKSNKEALELFAEARYLNNVCDARYGFLKNAALAYVKWAGEQEWCTDSTEYASSVVARIEKILEPDPQGDVSDGQCDTTCINDKISRFEQVDQLDDEYQLLMEKIVSKSMRDPAAQLIWWQQRVMYISTQLSLHDQIQDGMDSMPAISKPGVYKAAFMKLTKLYQVGKLNWEGYVMFNNQLVGKLDHRTDDQKAKLMIKNKFDPRDTADKLAFYTRRMEEEKSKIEFKALEFNERSLDALDNDLIPVEELVSHI